MTVSTIAPVGVVHVAKPEEGGIKAPQFDEKSWQTVMLPQLDDTRIKVLDEIERLWNQVFPRLKEIALEGHHWNMPNILKEVDSKGITLHSIQGPYKDYEQFNALFNQQFPLSDFSEEI